MIYRGYDIDDLAQYSTFEETVSLLLLETLPIRKELEMFRGALASQRELQAGIVEHRKKRKRSASPMDILQLVVPMLSDFDESQR